MGLAITPTAAEASRERQEEHLQFELGRETAAAGTGQGGGKRGSLVCNLTPARAPEEELPVMTRQFHPLLIERQQVGREECSPGAASGDVWQSQPCDWCLEHR